MESSDLESLTPKNEAEINLKNPLPRESLVSDACWVWQIIASSIHLRYLYHNVNISINSSKKITLDSK